MDALRTLPQVYAKARERLSAPVWDYLDLGAGDNDTRLDNRRAFDRWRFRPRLLTGMEAPKLSTTFLGVDLAAPLITAPFGADALFHPEGHLAIARANAEHGLASIAPEASSFSYAQIAEAAPAAARIFQLHAFGDVGHFAELLRRGESLGYQAFCVTLDCPTIGWREHLLESGYEPPASSTGGNEVEGSQANPWSVASSGAGGRTWSWDMLRDACSETRLPFACKGVLTAEDAVAARGIGAAAVIVSNHGGRQLDGAPATLDQLPEVRRAVGDGFSVGVDGGVRRGTDVLKALALGADVVLLGRAVAMGLAADGQAGVSRVLQLFNEELVTTMTLAGFEDVTKMHPGMVQPSHAVGGGEPQRTRDGF